MPQDVCTITRLRAFHMVMVMVVRVLMHMMVVVMILSAGLDSLVTALGVRGISPFRFLVFVPRASTVVAPSQPRSSPSTTLLCIDFNAAPEIAIIKETTSGTHTRGRAGSIGWMAGVRSAANTRSKAGEHSAKFHLNARVVAARADMSRLCSLNSLRKRRVAASAIQFRTDVQYSLVYRAITLFALLVLL